MATNVLNNHNQNPYSLSKKRENVAVFAIESYYLGILMFMSPIAMRVLFVLARKLNNEGYVVATLDDIVLHVQSSRSYVNQGILTLAKHNFIQKKKRGEYWMNPRVFRPGLIEL